MVAAGNSRKELDIMKSRIILNRERTAKAQEISIPIHGKGGELGIKAARHKGSYRASGVD